MFIRTLTLLLLLFSCAGCVAPRARLTIATTVDNVDIQADLEY